MASAPNLTVVPVDVSNRRELKRFIKFHYEVYRNDADWVAPLIIDYLERFNPKKNPYYHHSKIQPFMALRDDKVVGRITAHENTQHVAYHNEQVGFFGFFECIDDREVSDALLNAAADWLKEQGLETMRGPANLSVNGDPVGLLVDGFGSSPVLGMSYNPEYYQKHIESFGFTKAQDLYAYYSPVTTEIPERVKRVAERALRDPRLLIRRPDMKNYKAEIENLKFIYNEALSRNWGAVPMTDEEFDHFAGELKMAVDSDCTFIAEYDGKPVGLSMMFIDLNQALKPAKGRLLPFGLFKILLKKRSITWTRLPVLGVLETHRRKGIDAVFYYKSMIEGYKRGYRHGEMSWILESNDIMRKTLEHLGMRIYKTYRVYDRSLK